jgi:superfamily II DNA or RNA helicase
MLERVYTADHARAHLVLRAIASYVRDPHAMRALGFCVSVGHAQLMAKVFSEKGLPAVAVHSETSDAERRLALQQLRDGTVNVVFAKDLFNEGLDVGSVDTVLFLRPTESATIFLQQLGRGLVSTRGRRASPSSTSSETRIGSFVSSIGSGRSRGGREPT